MAGTTSAELYLRLLAERCLLDGEGAHPRGGSVSSAAAALLAVGAIPPETAEDVVSDYGYACFLRNRGGPGLLGRFGPGATPRPRPSVRAPRVVAVDADLQLPGASAHIQYVSLGDDVVTVGVTAGQISARGAGGGFQPPQFTITDDQGSSSVANFSGGGGAGGYEGVLATQGPLSRETRWIDIGAARLELGRDVDPPEVRVERLLERDPALAHLWNRLATGHHPMPMPGGGIDTAIDALVAVGALDPDTPELASLRSVAGVFGGPAARMSYPSWGNAVAKPAGLPQPWAALVTTRSRAGAPGPTGTIALGAVTPPIDGTVVVVVEALVSKADSFQITVLTTPGTAIGGPPGAGDPLAWWAEDDRGGVYLGAPNNWGGGPDRSRGTIQFYPPLDPALKELRVMPTGVSERAVIPVPLTWRAGR